MSTDNNFKNRTYSFKIKIRGNDMKVDIKNISIDQQQVMVNCKNKLTKKQLEYVKSYLYMEGFNDEAETHNLGLKKDEIE